MHTPGACEHMDPGSVDDVRSTALCHRWRSGPVFHQPKSLRRSAVPGSCQTISVGSARHLPSFG